MILWKPVWHKRDRKININIVFAGPRSVFNIKENFMLLDELERVRDSGRIVRIKIKATKEIPAPIKKGRVIVKLAREPPIAGPITAPTLIAAPSCPIFLLRSSCETESPTYAIAAAADAEERIPDSARAIKSA